MDAAVMREQMAVTAQHPFTAEEFLQGPHRDAGMAQLIDPYGKRNIICTLPYAYIFVQLNRGWTVEPL